MKRIDLENVKTKAKDAVAKIKDNGSKIATAGLLILGGYVVGEEVEGRRHGNVLVETRVFEKGSFSRDELKEFMK